MSPALPHRDADVSSRPSFEIPNEQHHALVPSHHTLGPTVLPPRFQLANSEDVLRPVVHADVHWFADGFVADRQLKLCSESGSSMPLLFDQTDVRDMLLQPRSSTATREGVLRRQKIGTEVV